MNFQRRFFSSSSLRRRRISMSDFRSKKMENALIGWPGKSLILKSVGAGHMTLLWICVGSRVLSGHTLCVILQLLDVYACHQSSVVTLELTRKIIAEQ